MTKANCAVCGGTGWVVTLRDGISGADRCECTVSKPSVEELAEQARIPKNFRPAFFETFSPTENPTSSEQLDRALLTAQTYARDFPKNPRPGLLLVGPTGSGKTHLAVAVLQVLLARGHEGVFFDYQNLLDQIRAGYDETLGTSRREAYRTALETEILLLDDLGSHRVNEWVEDIVTSIITFRYNHRKALIATTNLLDEKITGKDPHSHDIQYRIGERARSRLFEMCTVVRMPGVDDYRVKKARIW
jgi:DNA replication protein DnaC